MASTRPKPHIDLGSITKRRDRESFRNFVLEVIEDTFIFEVTPTSSSLDDATQSKFTLFLQKSDYNSDGDYNDGFDTKGYRFVYEDLVIADSKDYLDVYLYGVKQSSDEYDVEIFKDGVKLESTSNTSIGDEIRIVFKNSITLRPTDEVDRTDFEIKGKIEKVL